MSKLLHGSFEDQLDLTDKTDPSTIIQSFRRHGPLAMLDDEGRIRGATGSGGVNAFAMAHG